MPYFPKPWLRLSKRQMRTLDSFRAHYGSIVHGATIADTKLVAFCKEGAGLPKHFKGYKVVCKQETNPLDGI